MSWVDPLLRIIELAEGQNSREYADHRVIDTAGRTQAAYLPLAQMLQQNPLFIEAEMLVRWG